MGASKYNIVAEIPGTENYILANLLSGQADIISKSELDQLKQCSGHLQNADFVSKGYITDPDQEKQRLRLAYIDFLEQRSKEEVQIFFAPTYNCNFECSYCYQSSYHHSPEKLSEELIDGLFIFINTHLAQQKKYITLFGGEPFLSGKSYMTALDYFLELCGRHDMDVAAVSNGYYLDQYLQMLEKVNIREIQLTLDGPEKTHNRRRPYKGGKPSFSRIVSNIEECLSRGITVNLRVVVDKDNIGTLPELSRFAIDRGWTTSPGFKTQLGRNYELHHCHAGAEKLFSRLGLYGELYMLIQNHPEILEFHRPGFSAARFIKDNGALPAPLFDACPGCKSEWAFDYLGNIYSCTATVGKKGEELGSFFPNIKLNHEEIAKWQSRDVLSIKECRECHLQLLCGGGCGAIAKNSKGSILAADCRPVDKLLGMGISTYF